MLNCFFYLGTVTRDANISVSQLFGQCAKSDAIFKWVALFRTGELSCFGSCGNTKYMQAYIGILRENIPRPLHSTLHYVIHVSSSVVLTVISAITIGAPVVIRSHLLQDYELMEPLSHFPYLFYCCHAVSYLRYTPAEIQHGIISSVYSSPSTFFNYFFPFVPLLLPL